MDSQQSVSDRIPTRAVFAGTISRVVRRLCARVPWSCGAPLTLEDRNILLFSVDTALQSLMMGGIFTFTSVFVVRLGGSKLQVSLISSLPATVLMLFSIPAGSTSSAGETWSVSRTGPSSCTAARS
jgi:hypothetical protein